MFFRALHSRPLAVPRRAVTSHIVSWGQLAAPGGVLTRFRDSDAFVSPHDPLTRPYGKLASSIAFPTHMGFYQLMAEVNGSIPEYVWGESRGDWVCKSWFFYGLVGGRSCQFLFRAAQPASGCGSPCSDLQASVLCIPAQGGKHWMSSMCHTCFGVALG